jgi:hypothetical protein
MANTAMEYTDGVKEQYITENTNKISKMVKDIRGGQVAINITENTRVACYGERESFSHNKLEKFSELNIIKTS